MRSFYHFFFCGLAIFLASCNTESTTDCDYSDCDTYRPEDGLVHLEVTNTESNRNIPIIIYRGRMDAKDTFLLDTITTGGKDYFLPVDQYYSARAEYQKNGDKWYVVDGDRLELKSNVVCDSTCYEVIEINLDLRLKD